MTRCYEWYCLPDKCEELSKSGRNYVNTYVKLMKNNSVLFDKTPEDKLLFLRMREKYGSEGKYVRGGHKCGQNPTWDEVKTKRQCLSEAGLTEDDIRKKVGFHWCSLSKTELQRAISPRKEATSRYEPSVIPNESIEDAEYLEDKSTITCPNCGCEIRHYDHQSQPMIGVKQNDN